MIKLHQFPTAWDLPNPSPFCWKVEAYLRMAKLPYETVAFPNPRNAPKQKLPFVDDDGTVISDSTTILEHLVAKHGPLASDAKRSAKDRAVDHLLQRTAEEHFYFALLYSRWVDEDGWQHMRVYLHRAMPPVVRSIVPGLFRSAVAKQIASQGLGRHTPAEIYERGEADLVSFSAVLGDQPFFGGDEPSAIDATMGAFLGTAMLPPFDTTPKKMVLGMENLARYTRRFHERVFSA